MREENAFAKPQVLYCNIYWPTPIEDEVTNTTYNEKNQKVALNKHITLN